VILLLLALALHRPDLQVTPGVARPMTVLTLCATRWGLDRRHVTDGMKKRVATAYGVRWANRRAYEFDHEIPRELGGADDERNLWPQPLAEARLKDRLENKLHAAVCSGALSLETAQREIRDDWVAAYRKYLGDVPPRLAPHQPAHGLKRHSVPVRQFEQRRPRGVSSTQFDDVGRCQLGGAGALTDRRIAAPLRIAINGVVLERAQEEVFRPHATTHVAAVEHAKVRRDRADVQHPRNTVRFDLVTEGVSATKGPRDLAVARLIQLAGPQPAAIAFFDVTPEVRGRVGPLRLPIALTTAIRPDQRWSGSNLLNAAGVADGDRGHADSYFTSAPTRQRGL
jgi:hypothetical protein